MVGRGHAPLAALTSLQSLGFSGTKVSDVVPLAAPSNLRRLDITGTQVKDAAPFAHIERLEIVGGSGVIRRTVSRLFRPRPGRW